MSKTRADAKLKTLDAAVQAALWEFFATDATRKLKDAVPWLMSEHDVTTNEKRISDWFGWYERRLMLEEAESEATEIAEQLGKLTGISPEQIEKIGNLIFLNRATKLGDAKTFTAVAGVVQGRQSLNDKRAAHADKMEVAKAKLELQHAEQQRKLRELEMKVADFERRVSETKDDLGNRTLTEEQRAARMRERFGV